MNKPISHARKALRLDGAADAVRDKNLRARLRLRAAVACTENTLGPEPIYSEPTLHERQIVGGNGRQHGYVVPIGGN